MNLKQTIEDYWDKQFDLLDRMDIARDYHYEERLRGLKKEYAENSKELKRYEGQWMKLEQESKNIYKTKLRDSKFKPL